MIEDFQHVCINCRDLETSVRFYERLGLEVIERRTRSKRLPWDRFNAFLARHPLPPARIVHRYAT